MNGDQITRRESGAPTLQITFDTPSPGGMDCKTIMGLLAATAEPPMQEFTHASFFKKAHYLPTLYQAFGALEQPTVGGPSVAACADSPRGYVLVRVVYGGVSIRSVDPGIVSLILTSAAKSAGAVDGQAIPEPPPASAMLAQSGFRVELPTADTSWNVRTLKMDDGSEVDLIERKAPAAPELWVVVSRVRSAGSRCRTGTEVKIDGREVAVERPAYLASGWSSTVVEKEADGKIRKATLCGNPAGGGFVVVQLVYEASLRDLDFLDVKPILASLASSAGLGEGASSTSSAAPSRSAPSTSSSSGGGGEDSPNLRRWELAGFQLSPEDAAKGKSLGALLAVDVLTADPDEILSFALQGGLAAGYDSTGNVPFDAQGSLGAGLSLGPVLFVPLLGVGMDTVGAGNADSYKLPVGGYWDIEGRLRVAIGDGFAVDAGLMRASRNGDGPAHETRVAAHVGKTLGGDTFWALGFRFVDYGDAKLFGAGVGSSF